MSTSESIANASNEDFLAACAKDAQRRLAEAASVTIKNDGEIIDITLKDNGPYLRIVCDEPDERRPKDKPFSVYTYASKDEFYAKASDVSPAADGASDNGLKFMTKEEVALMLVKLVQRIEHHNKFFE